MKYAVLDIGSNSIRMLTCEVFTGQIIHAEKQLKTTRLGKGVNASGALAEDRMVASIEAIASFKAVAESQGVDRIVAMATSAVRDASNRALFLERVKAATGIDIEVLSGESEAEIGYLGVLKGVTRRIDELLVIDIGGGSTELILGNAKGIAEKISLNIGAVRMTDMFFTDGKADKKGLEAYMAEQLSVLKPTFEHRESRIAVGIGGTASTFAAMALALKTYDRERIHGFKVGMAQIEMLNRKLQTVDLDTRRKIPGLDPNRADIIIAGGIILQSLLSHFSYDSMTSSDFDNLEGYLYHKVLDI
jgi:exopolyphosphatase/guanosine-5'-triphosphate,3'-diphosphate pyrophosphatase